MLWVADRRVKLESQYRLVAGYLPGDVVKFGSQPPVYVGREHWPALRNLEQRHTFVNASTGVHAQAILAFRAGAG